MGLDMYAYTAAKAGQQNEFYEGAVWDQELKESVNAAVTKPRELAYWRKHANLHGWMHRLWESKGTPAATRIKSLCSKSAKRCSPSTNCTLEKLDTKLRFMTNTIDQVDC